MLAKLKLFTTYSYSMDKFNWAVTHTSSSYRLNVTCETDNCHPTPKRKTKLTLLRFTSSVHWMRMLTNSWQPHKLLLLTYNIQSYIVHSTKFQIIPLERLSLKRYRDNHYFCPLHQTAQQRNANKRSRWRLHAEEGVWPHLLCSLRYHQGRFSRIGQPRPWNKPQKTTFIFSFVDTSLRKKVLTL